MSLILECIIPACDTHLVGDSEEEVLRHAAEHAAKHHGMEEIDPPTVDKIRSAIRKA
jgi:predicted small metal-binding protein